MLVRILSVLLASAAPAAIFAVLTMHPPTDSAGWASWTQAALSVVAILASVSIVVWQARANRVTDDGRQWMDRAKQNAVAVDVLYEARAALKKVKAEFSDAEPTTLAFRVAHGELSFVCERLTAIDLARLHGEDAVPHFLEVTRSIRGVLSAIDTSFRGDFDIFIASTLLRASAETTLELMEKRLGNLVEAQMKAEIRARAFTG